MAKFGIIIPAAGDSSRFQGFDRKKPFVDLKGRPIWLRTVEHFVNRDDVSEVVLVLAESDVSEFRERFRGNLAFLPITITTGGATRADSVQNGLAALKQPCDFVAVHDAARPLLTRAWVNQIFEAAERHKAVIPAVKVSSTVKLVADDGRILKTVDRSSLMLAQTPQVFERTLLETAYTSVANAAEFTDEASLVEASNVPVFAIEAWPMNIKITTKDDFHMAEALLAALPHQGGLSGLL